MNIVSFLTNVDKSKVIGNLPSDSPILGSRYLLVDEISMVSKEYLHLMHLKLAASRRYGSNQLLGGINFIFFGDFLQFPPVAATSLLSCATNQNTVCADLIMNSINIHVELTDQKRQNDKEYLDVLTNIRDGRVTEKDYLFLKK